MIIGNGLIAKALIEIDAPEMVFFASGVSNSLETNKASFEREVELFKKTIAENKDRKFIYFSTLSIDDSSKKDSLIKRIESLNGKHTIDVAYQLGIGNKEYELVNID